MTPSESPFIVQNDQVLWITHYGNAPMSEQNVEGLLDLYLDIGGEVGRKLYFALHDAACRTSWFIQRPVIWRAEVAA